MKKTLCKSAGSFFISEKEKGCIFVKKIKAKNKVNFVFSKHALEQMELRGISKTIVEQILENTSISIEEDGIKIY